MIITHTLGFPRIGPRRELKRALEAYWAGAITESDLRETAATIRRYNWLMQKDAGIDLIASNDFSLYDHVLDTAVLVGAIPARYGRDENSLSTYFDMARGSAERDLPAMEMTKWFDTNYHYIVPEFTQEQEFRLASTKPFDEFKEAKALGIVTKPVILGPMSFLLLGKTKGARFDRLALLDRLLPVYAETLARLSSLGAEWVQLDEPCLALDRTAEELEAYKAAYETLREAVPNAKILLATYFERLDENLPTALSLPIDALHLDLVRAPQQLERALASVPERIALSLGIVDGRNVWRNDLRSSLALIERAIQKLSPERVLIAPSCSLLHVPYDLALETKLSEELRSWMAFAKQKLDELSWLKRAASGKDGIVEAEFERNARAMQARRSSPAVYDRNLRDLIKRVRQDQLRRRTPYQERKKVQQQKLRLPLLPTTTIGSFPQTAEVRSWRAKLRRGELSVEEYEQRIRAEIERTIRWQESVGLDVLVHGEFERSDMVEYFAEQLDGFALTENGWVQSYGSRCVRPPIIYGDVRRRAPMTLKWSTFAQSLTDKPVKGMLTGPVTMLQWSFVRDDQPRSETAFQVALALRDEVSDLERAGINIIQIDEPALREGLPLRQSDRRDYLSWAVDCFRFIIAATHDETQIHTHMCYAEFDDIIEAISEMDVDVISIESSRSAMESLDAFVRYGYPNEIGPGVYDVHSPRVPSVEEILTLLRKATAAFDAHRLWVNPDCGLKTRAWEQIRPSLANMVAATKRLRVELADKAKSVE